VADYEKLPGVANGAGIHDVPEGYETIRGVVFEDVVSAAADAFPVPLRWVGSNGKHTPANRTAADIEFVFLHSSEGGYEGAISWMHNNVLASYHFIVRQDGRDVAQMVSTKDIAWAGGTAYSNAKGLHICMAGYAAQGYSDECLKTTAKIVKWCLDKFEVPVQFAFDINNSTKRQLLRAGLAGHEHIPGADHTDPFADDQPGHRQRWEKFMEYVKGGSAPAPKPEPKPSPGKGLYVVRLKSALPKDKAINQFAAEADAKKEVARLKGNHGVEAYVAAPKAPGSR
jgi:hypothetical protein